MTPGLLGIDVGTSSTKAVVLDPRGHELGVARSPHPLQRPRQGWVETDPEDWWRSTCEAVGAAVTAAGVGVCSVGISGQMHGAVLVRADGSALRPAILWADQRAEPELTRYRSLSETASALLGNPLRAGMTGPVLCWLAEHEAERYAQASWALQAKDWLRLRLVGEAASEPSDASATLLYDLARRRWADGVISELGLRRELLAPLGEAGSLAGCLSPAAAEGLGLDAGLPVSFGAADTAAALVGTGTTASDPPQLTIGTGAQVVALRQEPSPDEDRRYHVFASALSGQYYALAAVQAAGLAFEWAWSTLGCDWPIAYGTLAGSAPGANGVSFIPHLAGAGSPSMSARASAAFVGLRLGHVRDDLIRSVFEGIAFSIRAAATTLPEFERASQMLLAGGGSLSPIWRQLLADTLDRPLRITGSANASCRGAALIGGMAAGIVHELPVPGPAVTVVRPEAPTVGLLRDSYGRWLEREAALRP